MSRGNTPMQTTMPTDKPRISVFFDKKLMDDFEKIVKARHLSKNKVIELMIRREVEQAKKDGEIK